LRILFHKLKEKYDTLKRQFKVKWCKNETTNRFLPFDFVIEEKRIIIELDGKQHFHQVSNWTSPEKSRINDLYKMKCANDNGFSVIRILQDDVYKNKYELVVSIDNLANNVMIQNIYMCKNDEYKDFDK